jgi:hypothetical protein
MADKIESALEEIRRIADGAYCASLDKFSSTPCLGFEAKVERGLFGKAEHSAHAEANKLMGRHFGMHEALRIIRDAISKQEAA